MLGNPTNINTDSQKTLENSQEKWLYNGRWYKIDANGYESLAEVLISRLLEYSNIESDTPFTFLRYQMEQVNDDNPYIGCSCEDLTKNGHNIINLDELFRSNNVPFDKKFKRLHSSNQRLKYLIDAAKEITGLENFPQYITLIFEIDALFLNTARSIDNINLIKADDRYYFCPIHNNSAGLLSNTKFFPLDSPAKSLISKALAKPLGITFNRQLAIAHSFSKKQLYLPKLIKRQILLEASPMLTYYPKSLRGIISNRICETIFTRQKFM